MIFISASQIKKIKTMQRALGLDDDAYREMLWGVARVTSCKDLKGPKIQLAIKHLEKCLGGVIRGQGPGAGKTQNPKPKTSLSGLRRTRWSISAASGAG